MRISSSQQPQPEHATVTLNGTTFTVESTGIFVNNTTRAPRPAQTATPRPTTCRSPRRSPGRAWARPRRSRSRASSRRPTARSTRPTGPSRSPPPTPAAGRSPGIGLTGTGAGTFSGTTDSSGCAIFVDQPAGQLHADHVRLGAGLVDKDGNAPAAETGRASAAGDTNTVTLHLRPAAARSRSNFQTPELQRLDRRADQDSIDRLQHRDDHGEVVRDRRAAPRPASITATPLFPFTSADAFYAGACTDQRTRATRARAIASVTCPANGQRPRPDDPSCRRSTLTVKRNEPGSRESDQRRHGEGHRRPNAPISGNPVKRTLDRPTQLGPSSRQAEPGLPWSTYDVCASASVSRHERPRRPTVAVTDPDQPAPRSTIVRSPAPAPASESMPADERAYRPARDETRHDPGRAAGRDRRRDDRHLRPDDR